MAKSIIKTDKQYADLLLQAVNQLLRFNTDKIVYYQYFKYNDSFIMFYCRHNKQLFKRFLMTGTNQLTDELLVNSNPDYIKPTLIVNSNNLDIYNIDFKDSICVPVILPVLKNELQKLLEDIKNGDNKTILDRVNPFNNEFSFSGNDDKLNIKSLNTLENIITPESKNNLERWFFDDYFRKICFDSKFQILYLLEKNEINKLLNDMSLHGSISNIKNFYIFQEFIKNTPNNLSVSAISSLNNEKDIIGSVMLAYSNSKITTRVFYKHFYYDD